MCDEVETKRFIVDCDQLPPHFPTHGHDAVFWEALGRAVAAFGFLEEMLGKAIFAFTATRLIPDNQIEAEYERWLPTLERALTDPLGNLIDSYGKAVRNNSKATKSNLDDLLNNLREAASRRNVICHGSWQLPDDGGRSVPFYVDKKRGVWETPIDVADLVQLRQQVAELSCDVVNTVTQMGYQFPGSEGHGNPIF
jgi:hypothetical protein